MLCRASAFDSFTLWSATTSTAAADDNWAMWGRGRHRSSAANITTSVDTAPTIPTIRPTLIARRSAAADPPPSPAAPTLSDGGVLAVIKRYGGRRPALDGCDGGGVGLSGRPACRDGERSVMSTTITSDSLVVDASAPSSGVTLGPDDVRSTWTKRWCSDVDDAAASWSTSVDSGVTVASASPLPDMTSQSSSSSGEHNRKSPENSMWSVEDWAPSDSNGLTAHAVAQRVCEHKTQ